MWMISPKSCPQLSPHQRLQKIKARQVDATTARRASHHAFVIATDFGTAPSGFDDRVMRPSGEEFLGPRRVGAW